MSFFDSMLQRIGLRRGQPQWMQDYSAASQKQLDDAQAAVASSQRLLDHTADLSDPKYGPTLGLQHRLNNTAEQNYGNEGRSVSQPVGAQPQPQSQPYDEFKGVDAAVAQQQKAAPQKTTPTPPPMLTAEAPAPQTPIYRQGNSYSDRPTPMKDGGVVDKELLRRKAALMQKRGC